MTTRRTAAMSRRRFVGGMGVLATGLALGATPASALTRTSRTMRVGVLLPASMRGAQVNRFMNGVRAGFDSAAAATRVRFVPSVRRFGIALGGAEQALTDLLSQPGFEAVIAAVPRGGGVAAVAKDAGVPLFVADVGGNVADAGAPAQSAVPSSFGYWQAAWALGEWAAREVAGHVFVCASHDESGYDSLYAFHAGFESAGGEVVGTAVTHVRPGDSELAAAVARMEAAGPGVVYAAYSGSQAVEFMRAWRASSLAASVPLLASGFAVDESVLSRIGPSAIGVRSCLPWAPTLETPGNTALGTAYSRLARVAPDAVAAHAYDTALLLARTVAPPDARRAPLMAFARGDVTAIPGSNLPSAPLYLREVRRVGGALRNAVVARLGTTGGVTALAADTVRPEIRTGWLAPYMGG